MEHLNGCFGAAINLVFLLLNFFNRRDSNFRFETLFALIRYVVANSFISYFIFESFKEGALRPKPFFKGPPIKT